jgi:hypothetical protein
MKLKKEAEASFLSDMRMNLCINTGYSAFSVASASASAFSAAAAFLAAAF